MGLGAGNGLALKRVSVMGSSVLMGEYKARIE